jgi:hypothetical protein
MHGPQMLKTMKSVNFCFGSNCVLQKQEAEISVNSPQHCLNSFILNNHIEEGNANVYYRINSKYLRDSLNGKSVSLFNGSFARPAGWCAYLRLSANSTQLDTIVQ